MKMLESIKLATKELDQFLLIKRVVDIYKNPELGKTKQHYELWIFAWLLALMHIVVYFFINLFPNYFLFDPDKHFNLAGLTVLLAQNAIVLALSISLMSCLIFKILGFKDISAFISPIFLRVIYVFSLSCILLSGLVVIEFNNIFKHHNYELNLNQILFLTPLLIFNLIMIIKMLVLPIYKIGSSKYRLASALSVVFILFFSIKINQFVSKQFPLDFFLNIHEIKKAISS